MAPSPHVYRRIAQQMRVPAPHAQQPWTPPSLSELVARIDAALTSRRAA